jgi:hypothetical protein
MADMLMKFQRRVVSYLYGCKPLIWIKVADFLKLLSKDDDENSHLLEVPKKLRENDDLQD